MEIGKYLVFIGSLIVFIGVLFIFSQKIPFLNSFGKMIGDINYQTKNVKIFIPFTSMIIVSLVITLVINLINRLFK